MTWTKGLVKVALLSIFLMACSAGSDKTDTPITQNISIKNISYSLRLIKEKETPIDLTISGHPVFTKLESNGGKQLFVHLLDQNKNFILLKYNTDLELQEKHTIRHGLGPDECLSPKILGGDENNIITMDIRSKRFFVLDRNLACKKRILNNTGVVFSWIPHGANYSRRENAFLICMANLEMKHTGATWHYHLYLKKIEDQKIVDKELFNIISPHSYRSNKPVVAAHPFHFALISNYVYILKPDQYGIIKMTLQGKIEKEITIDNIDKRAFSKTEYREWIEKSNLKWPRFTFPERLYPACWLMKLGKGIAVARRQDYNPEMKGKIEADYFDTQLNFLGKVYLPSFPGWNFPAGFAADQYFYSIGDTLYFIETIETETDELYRLSRWRIVYDQGKTQTTCP